MSDIDKFTEAFFAPLKLLARGAMELSFDPKVLGAVCASVALILILLVAVLIVVRIADRAISGQ